MSAQPLLIAINLCLAAAFFLLLPRRDRYFLNPVNTFWLTFVYFAVLQPAINLEQYGHWVGRQNVTFTLICFSLCAACLFAGNRVSIGANIAANLPIVRRESIRSLHMISFILLLTGAALTLVMVQAYGGWSAYFARSELRLLEIELSDYFTLGPRVATFALLVGLVASTYSRHSAIFIIYFGLATLLLAWHVYHGSRSSTILTVAIMIGGVFAPQMRSPKPATLVFFGILLAFAVGFIGAYRTIFDDFGYFTKGITVLEMAKNSFGFLLRTENTGFSNISIREDFGMAAAVIANVPYNVDFDNGYQFLQVFTQWVPRDFWPGKIYPDGESWDRFHRAAETSYYVNSAGFLAGPAPTIVGKYYYAFGLIGLTLGSFFSGVMLKVFWCYSIRQAAGVRAIFMVACSPIGFMEANNPWIWATFWLPTAGITLAIVSVLSRAKRKRWRLNL